MTKHEKFRKGINFFFVEKHNYTLKEDYHCKLMFKSFDVLTSL